MDCLILAVVFMGDVSNRKPSELDRVIHFPEGAVRIGNA